VEAGINGYFELSYVTSEKTTQYTDYDSGNTSNCSSNPFYSIIEVKSGEDTLTTISDSMQVFIDTTAKIKSTEKRYPTLYQTWNTSWMEITPEDADEYYYLVWEIKSYIQGSGSDVTQPYNFSLSDSIENLTSGEFAEDDYQFVGYKLSRKKNIIQNKTTQRKSNS